MCKGRTHQSLVDRKVKGQTRFGQWMYSCFVPVSRSNRLPTGYHLLSHLHRATSSLCSPHRNPSRPRSRRTRLRDARRSTPAGGTIFSSYHKCRTLARAGVLSWSVRHAQSPGSSEGQTFGRTDSCCTCPAIFATLRDALLSAPSWFNLLWAERGGVGNAVEHGAPSASKTRHLSPWGRMALSVGDPPAPKSLPREREPCLCPCVSSVAGFLCVPLRFSVTSEFLPLSDVYGARTPRLTPTHSFPGHPAPNTNFPSLWNAWPSALIVPPGQLFRLRSSQTMSQCRPDSLFEPLSG